MAKKIMVDGNTAAAQIAFACSEVAAIYPITPSSPMAETCDELASLKKVNIWGSIPQVVEMESEGGAYMGLYHGLFHVLYLSDGGQVAGIVYPYFLAVGALYLVNYAGAGGDKVKVKLTLKALLYYFHMEQAQEAAAEAKAQRHGGFRLV